MVIVNDLEEFKAEMVFIDGEIVAKEGRYLGPIGGIDVKGAVEKTVHVSELSPEDLEIPYSGSKGKVETRIIEIIPDQIITNELLCKLPVEKGEVLPDLERDIVKICVIERHHGTGRIGKGFVKGFGLKEGALASTVAHDSHNLIAIGASDDEMCRAINRIREINGGLVAVSGNEVKSELPLPIAGLMSDRDVGFVAERMDELNKSASELGCRLKNPFMALSFLALPVIPKLKITDFGLIDVEKMKVVPLFTSEPD